MGHVGHEALASDLQILQLVGHLVEAAAQLRRLVLPLNGDALGEIPFGIALDDVVHVHEGVDDPLGGVVRGEQDHEGRHHTDGQRPKRQLAEGFVPAGDVAMEQQNGRFVPLPQADEDGVCGKLGPGEVSLHSLRNGAAAAQGIRRPGLFPGQLRQRRPFFIRICADRFLGIQHLYEELSLLRQGSKILLVAAGLQHTCRLLALFRQDAFLHTEALHTGNKPDPQAEDQQQRKDRHAL